MAICYADFSRQESGSPSEPVCSLNDVFDFARMCRAVNVGLGWSHYGIRLAVAGSLTHVFEHFDGSLISIIAACANSEILFPTGFAIDHLVTAIGTRSVRWPLICFDEE